MRIAVIALSRAPCSIGSTTASSGCSAPSCTRSTAAISSGSRRIAGSACDLHGGVVRRRDAVGRVLLVDHLPARGDERPVPRDGRARRSGSPRWPTRSGSCARGEGSPARHRARTASAPRRADLDRGHRRRGHRTRAWRRTSATRRRRSAASHWWISTTSIIACAGQDGSVIRLATVTLVVRDYDEAMRWFVDVLGFAVVEDTPLTGDKRWVVVGPPDGSTRAAAREGERCEPRGPSRRSDRRARGVLPARPTTSRPITSA